MTTAPEEEAIPAVWYATPGRVSGVFKVVVMDDTGELRLGDDAGTFRGKRGEVTLSGVRSVALARQQLPWPLYLVANAALVGYYYVKTDGNLNPERMAAFLVVLNALVVWVGWTTRWVRVEHADAAGQPQTSYFADGSRYGWGGMFGGTKRLHDHLARMVRTPPPAT